MTVVIQTYDFYHKKNPGICRDSKVFSKKFYPRYAFSAPLYLAF